VLSSWLEPDEAARTLSVDDAITLLSQDPTAEAAAAPGPAAAPAGPEADRPPYGSRIRYMPGSAGARYVLPAGRSPGRRRMGSFGVAWIVFVGFWVYSAVRMKAPAGFLLFAVPFVAVGVGMLRRALISMLGKLELQIGPSGLSYSRRFLFAARRRTVPLRDVGPVREENGLVLDIGARTLRLGQGLSYMEQEWLRESLNRDLQGARAP
jgi:hypothetical protein